MQRPSTYLLPHILAAKKALAAILLCSLFIAGNPTPVPAGAPIPLEPQQPRLGEALRQPPVSEQGEQFAKTLSVSVSVPADRTGGWTIDPSDRQVSRSFYNSVYLASEETPIVWSGNVAGCNQGTTAADFKNGVLVRVNYFRAMAGSPADISFADYYNNKAQQAALMMSSNNSLDHTPPDTWSCYTADGAEAAGNSNLSLGNYGWNAVSSQVRDNGATNTAVGHRRWILYPQTQTMGTGDIPPSASNNSANSLWVFDGNFGEVRPATREAYVAWPPPGYVPYQVIPARWSFSYAGADFSAAAVSMTRGGNPVSDPVSVLLHAVQNGYGENTLTWVADGLDADSWSTTWPNPGQDTRYTVQIANVSVGGTPTSFSYDVTVIDPAVRSAGEIFPIIDTNINPRVGEQRTFTFSAVPFAHSYEVIQASLQNGEVVEGGENNLDAVIDGTSASYNLLTNATSFTGSNSFHLAHPDSSLQFFELDHTFIPSTTSNLQFQARLGYATTTQHALAQVSVDNGQSWATIYDQPGTGGPGQSSFSAHTVPLTEFADTPIRIRFGYQYAGGSYYYCTDSSCGFLVDDILVTSSQEFANAEIIAANSDRSFPFTRQSAAPYALAVRTIAWEGYPALEWGPLYYLPSAPSTVGLRDAIERLGLLAAGSRTITLAEVIEILRMLTGR